MRTKTKPATMDRNTRTLVYFLIFIAGILIIVFSALPFVTEKSYKQPWTPVNTSAGWSERLWHSCVAMPDGTIVLMGGQANGLGIVNDVWLSEDYGVNWTRINVYAPWQARNAHSSVVLPDGSIVLMGGQSSSGSLLNDVWRSEDSGISWTLMTPEAAWSPRWFHNSVAMPDGSIVLFGGIVDNRGGNMNDVWRSADKGATWTLVNASAGWSPRNYQSGVALHDGSIFVMGGYEGGIGRGAVYLNDVWQSKDYGATWTQVTGNSGWLPRWGHTSVATPDNTIILTGGYDSHSMKKNDSWQSRDDGITWIPLNESNGWPARVYHTTVVMPDGSIVLMGGDSGTGGVMGDVWRVTPEDVLWI